MRDIYTFKADHIPKEISVENSMKKIMNNIKLYL